MEITIIGYGDRGSRYAAMFASEGVKVKAVCEIRPERLENAGKLYNLPKDKLFLSDKKFIAAGKLADLCVVSTQDGQHREHAIAALGKGYDVLVEKPIATNLEDVLAVYKKAKELKRRVFVGHVLRYAPFFSLIKKELDSGAYGKIALINLTENVGDLHQAHSFVRGNWHKIPPAAPMIVAKCCHDLDIISWYAGAECKGISSMGSLGFFTKENAPKGSSGRCLTCAVKADCRYDAEKYYIFDRADRGDLGYPVNVICDNPTKEKVYGVLKNGPYGRCVWKCDNNAVDRQIVNMEFEGGMTAHLTMTAFANSCYREIHVHCERGEIYGNLENNILTCNLFGKDSKKINVSEYAEGSHGHGGGDARLVKDIVAAYTGQPATGLTSIENSMQSHAMGFAAEESRLAGGKVMFPNKLN